MTASTLLPARQRVVALWRKHPRESAALGTLALAGMVAVGGAAWSTPNLEKIGSARAEQTAPQPPPLLIRDIAPDQALAVNNEIPMASGPNPVAAPFSLGNADAATRARALDCLASAVYYEAGNQSADGERAVAQVVLNRMHHPGYPSTICGVVYQGAERGNGCQFTFTCDGSLNRQPDAEGWRRATAIAAAALAGAVYAPVGWATHYHADYVVPYWASSMAKNAVVGAHLFYRWAGGWGQPAVFAKSNSGNEPNAAALRTAALAVPHVAPSYGRSDLAEAINEIPGAQAIKLAPSLRGDKRVAVRFNLAARKASDDAAHQDYSKKFEVSDNLKWSLSSDTVGDNQKPLGKSTSAPAGGVAVTASAAGASAQR